MRERQHRGSLPDEADECGLGREVELSGSRGDEDDVAAPPRARNEAHVGDEPDAADDRRRRDRASVGVVVERDVAGNDRDAERLRRLRRCPRSPARAPSRSSGFSGLPKLRQSVSASGSPPAQATLRAAPSTASTPARNGSRSPGGGPAARPTSPRSDGRSRRTAASSPGRRTVREPTSWSYCS